VYARIAHFEGLDTSRVGEQTAEMKRQMETARGGNLPEGLPAEAEALMETVTRWVQLVDRATGQPSGSPSVRARAI